MPQNKSDRNWFGKHISSSNLNPCKWLESGANKVDHLQSNKKNINLAHRPEQKEGNHKISEAKYSDPPR